MVAAHKIGFCLTLLAAPVAAFARVHGPTTSLRRHVITPRTSHAPALVAAAPLGTSSAIFGAANALGFAISAATGWHYHLDLIGTGIFAVAALALRGATLAQGCSAGAVALWACKLAGFLFYRALLVKKDARLDETLSTTSGQVGFWTISFLWGWLVSLPHTLAASVPVGERPAFGPVHVAGLVLFVAGLAIETAADWQKWLFKADAANRGKFCDVGVWRLCQHPNWFGNLALWSGILLLNAPTLLAVGTAPALVLGPLVVPAWLGAACRFGVAALSPLFLLKLFSGQANGVPPLNKGYDLTIAKFGKDAAWQAYNAKTPLLLPTWASAAAWLRGK